MKKVYILGLILGVSILTARADIIPTLDPSAVAAASGGFTWNYKANVTVDETVNTGDFFTIYDFGNFVSGSNLQPAGWTFSFSLLTTAPAHTSPTDDPSLYNLTWTYNGTSPISGAAALGDFSVVASTNQLRTADFAALATRSNDPTNTKISNVGSVSVPVPEMSALLPILSVCTAGLLSLLPSFLRRRATI
jgi:hypothetical protein